ncbi:MAG: VCBS repeat-containing protein [Planctomycetes bacterium]|nr:VCBS repeat-containing protein [Planctomycetota bacterium]
MFSTGQSSVTPLIVIAVAALTLSLAGRPAAALDMKPAQLIQASGVNIDVGNYSVPSFVDWNEDGLRDLVVGEQDVSGNGKVRVYLNTGTAGAPAFLWSTYVQAGGADLQVPGSGCLGAFPRVVDWDCDGKKDLLIGQSDGMVKFYANTASNEAPAFEAGAFLQVGDTKYNIDVGSRATIALSDWNNDGVRDLLLGELNGKVLLYVNEGTNAQPDFIVGIPLINGGNNLVVPSGRSSPAVFDMDGDGKKDLLTGNTDGQLLLYSNQGTDSAPVFSGYSYVTADGVSIDLIGSRSRPFITDWTGDGIVDALLGASDGMVYLYEGIPEPTSLALLAGCGVALLRRRRL